MAALASYDFAGNATGREASETASTASGVTAGLFERGPGLVAPSWAYNPDAFVATPVQSDGAYANAEIYAAAKGHYYSFSITPDAGKQLSISGVDITPWLQSVPPGADYRLWYKRSSSSTWSGSSVIHSNQSTAPTAVSTISASLSNVTELVEFRLLVWGATSYTINLNGGYSGGDIVVNGTVSDATPATPTALDANSLSQGKGVKLTWTDNATNETGYRIERDFGDAPNLFPLTVFNIGANQTTYTDHTATPGIRYIYRVVAINGSASSAQSNGVKLMPFQAFEAGRAGIGSGARAWWDPTDPLPNSNQPTAGQVFGINSRLIYGSWFDDDEYNGQGAFEYDSVNGRADYSDFKEDEIYHQIDLAIEGADTLGVDDIWIFTDFEWENFFDHDNNPSTPNNNPLNLSDPATVAGALAINLGFTDLVRDYVDAYNIANATDYEVYLGIYTFPIGSIITRTNPYNPTWDAHWREYCEDLVDDLFGSGGYDVMTPPIYPASSPNEEDGFTFQDTLDSIDNAAELGEDFGIDVLPFLSLYWTPNPWMSGALDNTTIDALAEKIRGLGNRWVRWEGSDFVTPAPFSNDYDAAQARLVEQLQQKVILP